MSLSIYYSGCTIFRLVGPGLCVASISTLLVAAVACVCTIATSVITRVERSVRANCIEVAVGYVFESLLLFVNWRIDFLAVSRVRFGSICIFSERVVSLMLTTRWSCIISSLRSP